MPNEIISPEEAIRLMMPDIKVYLQIVRDAVEHGDVMVKDEERLFANPFGGVPIRVVGRGDGKVDWFLG